MPEVERFSPSKERPSEEEREKTDRDGLEFYLKQLITHGREAGTKLRDAFNPLLVKAGDKVSELSAHELRELAPVESAPYRFSYSEFYSQAESDPAKWDSWSEDSIAAHVDSFEKDVDSRRITHIRRYRENMIFNAQKAFEIHSSLNDIASGRFEEFLWSELETDLTKSILGSEGSYPIPYRMNAVMVPVGEYGTEFAFRLVDTTKRLARLVERFIETEEQPASKSDKELLLRETARGRDLAELSSSDDIELSVVKKAVIQEGILSLAEVISLLTAKKLEGVESPNELLKKIITGDFAAKTALLVTVGVVGPLIVAGRYVPSTIEIKDGHLHFTQAFIHNMRAVKREYHQNLTKETLEYYEEKYGKKSPEASLGSFKIEGFHGSGCPVAHKSHSHVTSGLESLSRAFLHVYKSLDD